MLLINPTSSFPPPSSAAAHLLPLHFPSGGSISRCRRRSFPGRPTELPHQQQHWIARRLCMNGLDNAEVAKELDALATITKAARRLFANAYPALELVMFCILVLKRKANIREIAGYVQKITACKDIDVMEDLDNGRPP
ncbi:hypothetical protein ACH5RR_002246 [Cinchona calisaya]|uniref:Uncharacterized protein n=1 Tax=Cinchona calisaya TaxID=153742 RepID=A0ABD3B6B4_9GENT